jgi:hypothetical protein
MAMMQYEEILKKWIFQFIKVQEADVRNCSAFSHFLLLLPYSISNLQTLSNFVTSCHLKRG